MITVATNGCFDILHAGHVDLLRRAAAFGDRLIVGLNSDESVRQLKGKTRPINCQEHRKMVLESLRFVDEVRIFDAKDATGFLLDVKPTVWIKGGDYTLETLNPLEKLAVESSGGRAVILPFTFAISTTAILAKV